MDDVDCAAPINFRTIFDFVFPAAGRIVLVTSDGRVFSSRDSGQTWSQGAAIAETQNHSCSFKQLAVGADSTVWGLYDSRRSAEPAAPYGVAVSQDGMGVTFADVIFDPPSFTHLYVMIPTPGDDPLILAGGGSIWRHAPEHSMSNRFEFVAMNPDGGNYAGVICGEYLLTSRAGSGLWMSSDGGKTWEGRLAAEDYVAEFACGLDGDIWLLMGDEDRVWQFGADDVWHEVADFDSDAGQGEHISSIAVHADVCVAAVTTDETGPAQVVRVLPSGQILATPELSAGRSLKLRVDPTGVLWAAGSGLFRLDDGGWTQVWSPD